MYTLRILQNVGGVLEPEDNCKLWQATGTENKAQIDKAGIHVPVLSTVAVAPFHTKTVTVTMKRSDSVKADVEEQIRKTRLEIKI